jgi:hypothetical protein
VLIPYYKNAVVLYGHQNLKEVEAVEAVEAVGSSYQHVGYATAYELEGQGPYLHLLFPLGLSKDW